MVVDDHATFHAAVGELLELAGFDVVGGAFDGAEALAECHRLSPDVVLLDVQLPDVDGFVVADLLAGVEGAPDVVLISARDASTYGDRVTRAQAVGFIAKRDISGPELNRLLA